MDHETAGDPVRGLKWTRRTTAKVAAERAHSRFPGAVQCVGKDGL